MKGIGLKKSRRENRDKGKEEFWNKIEEIEKIDSDIASEVAKGRRVKIVFDSENKIDVPEYPESD